MKKWTTLAAIAVLGIGATTIALRGQSDEKPAATDATAATVSLDAKVEPFALPDATTGKNTTVGDWKDAKASVVLFIATKCPVSNDYNERMAKIAADYAPKGIKFYGINSNKAELMPEIAEHTKDNKFSFPVLKDTGNKIADRFDAKVTPEVFVVSATGDLVYHGHFDNKQKEAQVTQTGLKDALDAVLAGQEIPAKETRAFGCSIKR